jgi:putative NADH-flavin reductase
MSITIIGASAGIGLETVKRGLNRNHSITTLSRSEINIEEKQSLTMILGDATNKADLFKSIQNADALIVTLYQSDLIFSPKLIKKDIIKCASIFSFIIF